MRRGLITGVTGFLGTHLARHLLDAGWRVTGAARDPARLAPALAGRVEVQPLDVRDRGATQRVVAGSGAEVVFHLAGQASVPRSFEDPAGTMEVNALGAWNVALAAGEAGAAVLLASTGYVYGHPRQDRVNEDHPTAPNNPYAVSKLAAEALVLAAAEATGGRALVTRLFNSLGPGQGPGYVAPDFLAELSAWRDAGGQGAVRTGSLDSLRDYTDARDVVRALRQLAEASDAEGTFNVGSGEGRPARAILEGLARVMQVEPPVEVDPARVRPGEVRCFVADPGRLQAATGWRPEIELQTSLEDLVASRRDG